MTTEEKETTETKEPTDAVNSASTWSKVSKKQKANHRHFYWLAGGAVAAVLVLALSSGHETNTSPAKKTSGEGEGYQSSLNANLAHLRSDQQSQATPATPEPRAHALLNDTAKKSLMARQNAPTSMYTSESSPMPHTAVSEPAMRQATLVGQGSDTQFANANSTTTQLQATRIPHPGFTIASGEFLHAVLETAINSDLPGMVRAVVSKPVYSYTGERAIMPAGSRLIGQYSSAMIQGQNRVMIIWNRAVLPSGIAIQLNSPGTDALGRAGQGADNVNTHFLARFGESALLSLIGAGTATAGVNNTDQYNSAAQYRTAMAQSFQQSAQQSLQGTLPIKPTLHIDQGASINVFVAHDLSFYQVLKGAGDAPRSMPDFTQ